MQRHSQMDNNRCARLWPPDLAGRAVKSAGAQKLNRLPEV